MAFSTDSPPLRPSVRSARPDGRIGGKGDVVERRVGRWGGRGNTAVYMEAQRRLTPHSSVDSRAH